MLKVLSCLDSMELAESHRLQLDIARTIAAALGRSAVQAAERGYYISQTGTKVDWSSDVQTAISGKISIPPNAPLPSHASTQFPETRVQVSNETTLGASRPLVNAGLRPLALNFANGVHPGGGFLGGARAQEEALCRSSALYHTLVGDQMYPDHRLRSRKDSSDWAIYSPRVPVFRSDDGSELEHPWLLDFITCAAPYAPDILQPEAGDLLQRRIHRVLAISQAYAHTALVLGAWGCGAFENDTHRTALDFRKALEGEFSGAFSDVVFAITDWSTERRFLGPFRDVFTSQ